MLGHRPFRFLALRLSSLIIIGLLVASMGPAVAIHAATGAFTITPTSGLIGTIIRINATGFTANTGYTIKFGTTIVDTGNADASGNFTDSFEAPSLHAGEYLISVTTVALDTSTAQKFTITTEIHVNDTSGYVGDQPTVTGIGFLPNSNVYINFDGVRTATVVADADGEFSSAITIPASSHGKHRITASDAYASTPAVDFTTLQEFSISPSSGTVGSGITLTGTGFAANSNVALTMDGDEITSPAITTSATGSFNATFIIPPTESGSHELAVEDASGNSDSKAINVSHYATITPTSGIAGERIDVTGSGFQSDSNVTLTLDGANLGSARTALDGSFETSFNIPPGPGGQRKLQVRDTDGNALDITLTIGQKISIDPISGLGGSSVTISGTGFGPKSPLSIKYNSNPVTTDPISLSSDSKGGFTATFKVPVGLIGDGTVTVSDGAFTASAGFTATFEANMTPETNVTSPGYVNMQITISGANFQPDARVTITRDSAEQSVLAVGDTDVNGAFSISFTMPAGDYGDHMITVSDGVNIKQFPFIMESKAPSVPAMLLPEPDIRARQPVIFKWAEVADPSGVTYILQISTDEHFNNVVLEKKGLAKPEYTLSDSLSAVSRETPYYWRVKAIDGTGNSSQWSEGIPFHVGLVITISDDGLIKLGDSITLPLWTLYISVALSVLLIGVIGFLVGRKTLHTY